MPEPRLGEVIITNNLTSTSTTAALSANMGRVLNESILELEDQIPTPATDADIDALFT